MAKLRPIWAKRITGIAAVLIAALAFALPCAIRTYAESEIVVPVKVSYSGNGLPSETFTVHIKDEATGNVVAGDITLSAGMKSGEINLSLGNLAEGIYIYELREVAGSNADINYDSTVYSYYVEVKADGTVEQRAVNKADDGDKPDQVEFANSYIKSGPDEVIGDPPVRVRKIINGKEPEEVSQFVFIMKPERADYPLPDVAAAGSGVIKDGAAEVYLNGAGEIEIGNITFTEEGTYRYFVSEKDEAVEGYDYDGARYTVTYNVSRNQNGELTCVRTMVRNGEEPVSECSFENIYDPNPVTRKVRRGVKTGDPYVMWPLTAVLVACMVSIALIIDRRNRREAEHGKR